LVVIYIADEAGLDVADTAFSTLATREDEVLRGTHIGRVIAKAL
jgi:hypothetical protein